MNTKLKLIFPSRVIVLMISSILVALGTWIGIVYSQGNPSAPNVNPGTNFSVCTGGVNQDACYNPSSSITRLNWTYSSTVYGQMAFWVQVDNNGNLDGNFPSPEINTGWINSSNNYYDILPGSLQSDTTYYWKMAVADTHGSWSGWTCADTSFTTPAPCNNPPSATNLQVTQPDYCLVGWANAIFSWTFTDPGDTQSAYRIQVDNNSGFPSPEVDSAKVVSASNSFATQAGQLSFNNTYYWRLMVWDSKDAASSWISGTSFTTPRHAYPYIDFTWIPQNPTVDENTQFTDQSTVYGGTVKSSWYWTFQNGSPSTSAIQNPLIKFLSTGAKSITLKVTDSDGFNCTGQKTLNTLLKLPDWKEIAPF